MEILKVIASCLYVFGIPGVAIYVLIARHRHRTPLPFVGWFLLITGSFTALAMLATYIPNLPAASKYGREILFTEITAFAIWFLPAVAMVCLGWALRRN